MPASDDDRIAYLAGESTEGVPEEERAGLEELRGLLAAPATWAEPAPELEDNVVAAITAEAQARPGSSRASRSPSRLRLPSLSFAGGSALAGLALVAVVAIVVGVGQGGSSPAPKQFAMVVTGTELAPSAHGNATLTKTNSGWRIELAASGLPHLANGLYYEAWLKNPAGVLVPVGTFNDAKHVTLWAGVPPSEFPNLTVTVQRADGNPASSGKKVLLGTLRGAQ